MKSDSVWVIYNRIESIRNEAFIKILINEFSKHNIDLLLIIDEKIEYSFCDSEWVILYNKRPIKRPLFVLNRTPNSALSKLFEQMQIRVFNNSRVSETCNDKLSTFEYLSELGVPVLDTALLTDSNQLFYPSVIKPANSKGGEGVYLLNSFEDFLAVQDYVADTKYIIQPPAKVLGKDVRAYVIGNEIIVAIMREAQEGFKSNFTLGGSASLYTLNNEEKEIINHISQNLKSDFVGIDFMFDSNGIVINEIEDVVGSRMVYELTDINIASLYANHAIKLAANNFRP